MNDALPDRPITWQESLLAGVLGLILPGAGLLVAGLALIVANRADQTRYVVSLTILCIWNILLTAYLLSTYG